MPDGGISPVRFEVLAFVNEPSHFVHEVQALARIRPIHDGLLIASFLALATVWCARFSQAEPAPVVGTAKYPESLCPRLAFPPLGKRVPSPPRTLLPVLRSYGLMRQSRWLSCPSVIHLVPGVSAGCCQPLLPTASSRLYSANLSSDAWSPTPTVPSSAFACFFLKVIGLPKGTKGSASRFYRERDFSAGYFSRLQTFLYVQASEFARLPDRSHRCKCSCRAAEAFTSGLIVLRCLCAHRICYPSEYRHLTEKGLSPF